MTDHAALVARLREDKHHWTPKYGYSFKSMAQVMLDAADAIEQLTRTVAEQTAQLAEAWARTWPDKQPRDVAGDLADEISQLRTLLTAASARLRTVEAETWEQAAQACGLGARDQMLAAEFRRRAHAAREGT
jgi:ubiquinone biosynthesis protein UbiJ